MYRRVLSLLLLPCVLLTQSVAFGHSHVGGQPAGHDLREHIHTNPVVVDSHNAHGHRHHHGPGGHHHHHDDVTDTAEPNAQPKPQPEQPSDHDTDAIFVNATDAVMVERSEAVTQVESLNWWSFSDSAPFAACDAVPPIRSVICAHPPPGQLCPLYIRHLSLLI